MPIYSYTALSEKGVTVHGQAPSPSIEELTDALSKRGLRVQLIKPLSSWRRLFRARVAPLQQFILFLQEFISLQKAGLTLGETLEMTLDRPGNKQLEEILSNVLREVQSGRSLSTAFEQYQEFFDDLFIVVIKTGERSGDLTPALEQYLSYLRSRMKIIRRIKQAISYPIFLLVSLQVILAVMFLFVMPRFISMYASFDAKLPLPTTVLIDISRHFPLILAGMLLTYILAHFAWKSHLRESSYGLKIEKAKYSLPLIGNILTMSMVSRIARSMAMLVAAGTPLVEAVRFVRENMSSRLFSQKLSAIENMLTEGDSLSRAIETNHLMPKTAIKLIRVGEASGDIQEVLFETARYYEEIVENNLERLMSIVEPTLVLFMGLIVGAVIISMYLPIFTLADVIR